MQPVQPTTRLEGACACGCKPLWLQPAFLMKAACLQCQRQSHCRPARSPAKPRSPQSPRRTCRLLMGPSLPPCRPQLPPALAPCQRRLPASRPLLLLHPLTVPAPCWCLPAQLLRPAQVGLKFVSTPVLVAEPQQELKLGAPITSRMTMGSARDMRPGGHGDPASMWACGQQNDSA